MKKGNAKLSLLLGFLALSAPIGASFAQEDPLLLETSDSIVNTDQIDIDGLYSQKKKQPTEADRLQKFRREMEEKHEQMMRKKVEDMRLAEERKLAKKLQMALSGQLDSMDSVSTSSAAPAKSEAKIEAPESKDLNNSVTLSGGFLNVSSDKNDFEASTNIRLGLESKVLSKLSVGVGVRYTTFETSDGDNNYLNASNFNTNNYGYYNYNTANAYGATQARTINFKQLSFDLNTKVFFTAESKIRPFVGGMVAYNRGSYKYEQNNQYTYGSYQYGDEKVTNNNFSAAITAGAQVLFTPSFSAELNVQYERALNSGVSDLSRTNTPDEQRLRNLAFDLEDANMASINVGLSLNF